MKFVFYAMCLAFIIGTQANPLDIPTTDKRSWGQSPQGMCYFGSKMYKMTAELILICHKLPACNCGYVVASWW